MARGWFPDSKLLHLFTSIRQFEGDCRSFLNQLNLEEGDGQLVPTCLFGNLLFVVLLYVATYKYALTFL